MKGKIYEKTTVSDIVTMPYARIIYKIIFAFFTSR